MNGRHPVAKSAQIQDSPGDGEKSDEASAGLDVEVLRRQSTGSVSSAALKRPSTGSEPTPTQTDVGQTGRPESRLEKPYRCDVDHIPCRDSDVEATASSLLRHAHPARRHSGYDPVRQVNQIDPPSSEPADATTIVQGFAIQSDELPRLSQAASPMSGPPTRRLTSLTHFAQPAAPPQSRLAD